MLQLVAAQKNAQELYVSSSRSSLQTLATLFAHLASPVAALRVAGLLMPSFVL